MTDWEFKFVRVNKSIYKKLSKRLIKEFVEKDIEQTITNFVNYGLALTTALSDQQIKMLERSLSKSTRADLAKVLRDGKEKVAGLVPSSKTSSVEVEEKE